MHYTDECIKGNLGFSILPEDTLVMWSEGAGDQTTNLFIGSHLPLPLKLQTDICLLNTQIFRVIKGQELFGFFLLSVCSQSLIDAWK